MGHGQLPPLREQERLDLNSGTWAPVEPSELESTVVELRNARQSLIEGRPAEAREMLKDWLKANEGHERRLEGVFLLGESLFDLKDYFAAYEQYEIVIADGSGDLYRKALTREMDVARAFLAGEPRRIWKTVPLPAYDDGIEILDKIWERAPGTRLGEEALRLKADYFFQNGDADLAQQEYATLSQEYPNGRYKQLAMLRSAESAERAFPGVKFDDRPLVEADERYRQMEQRFPAYAERERVDARRKGIRDQRAAKDLDIADWYLKTERQSAAVYYLRVLIRDWPDSFAATEARSRLLALGLPVEAPVGDPPTDSAPATWPAPQETPERSAPPEEVAPSDSAAPPMDAAPMAETPAPEARPSEAAPVEPVEATPAPMDNATPMAPAAPMASPAAKPSGSAAPPMTPATPTRAAPARPSTMGSMSPAQPATARPAQPVAAPAPRPGAMGSMSPAPAKPNPAPAMQPRPVSPPAPRSAPAGTMQSTPSKAAPPTGGMAPVSPRPATPAPAMNRPPAPAAKPAPAPTGTMRAISSPPRPAPPSTLPARTTPRPPPAPKKIGTMKDVKG